jgi:hypothetical protein
VQHLAGLVTATLLYALLLRLSAPRWAALGAAALVALDGYAIALEQHLMAEAFFTLALAGAIALAVEATRGSGGRRALAAAGAGALIAGAATMRPIALSLAPIVLLYLVVSRVGVRAVLAACAALVVPLAAYATFYGSQTGSYSVSPEAASGWFLYGRVGQLVDCRGFDPPAGTERLCTSTAYAKSHGPSFYIFDSRSPAQRLFGPPGADPKRSSKELRRFAVAMIRHRPGPYAKAVGSDFLRFFTPGARSPADSDRALGLPARREAVPAYATQIQRRYLPGYSAHAGQPGTVVRDYVGVVHTPRWLLAAFALCVLGELMVLITPARARLTHWREVILTGGGALVMLFAISAGSAFVLRYLLPAVPLLAAGGVLAGMDLVPLARPYASRLRSRLRASHLRPRGAPAGGR